MADGNWRAPFAIGLVAGAVFAVLLCLVFPDQSLGWFSHTGALIVFADTFANWMIALFSVVAAALLWKTLRATQEMANDTRRIGEAQVKAYLDIKLTQVVPTIADRSLWNFRVSVRNSGQSPARQIYVNIQAGEGYSLFETILPDLGAGEIFEGGIEVLFPPKVDPVPENEPLKPFIVLISTRFLDVFYGPVPERTERRNFSVIRTDDDAEPYRIVFIGDHAAMFEQLETTAKSATNYK